MAKDVLVKTRFKTVPSLSPTYIQRSKSTHPAQILEIHPLMRHSSNPAAWPGLRLHGGAWAPPQQVRFNRNLDACPRPIFYMRHFRTFFLPVHKYSVFFYTIHRSAATQASVMLKFHSGGITVQALERTDAALRNVFSNVLPITRTAPPLDMSCIRCLHREGGQGTWRGEWPAACRPD